MESNWSGAAGACSGPRGIKRLVPSAALSVSRRGVVGCGLALGLSVDVTEVDRLAADLEQHFPEGTTLRFNHAPVLRALAALNRQRPAEAMPNFNRRPLSTWPRSTTTKDSMARSMRFMYVG